MQRELRFFVHADLVRVLERQIIHAIPLIYVDIDIDIDIDIDMDIDIDIDIGIDIYRYI